MVWEQAYGSRRWRRRCRRRRLCRGYLRRRRLYGKRLRGVALRTQPSKQVGPLLRFLQTSETHPTARSPCTRIRYPIAQILKIPNLIFLLLKSIGVRKSRMRGNLATHNVPKIRTNSVRTVFRCVVANCASLEKLPARIRIRFRQKRYDIDVFFFGPDVFLRSGHSPLHGNHISLSALLLWCRIDQACKKTRRHGQYSGTQDGRCNLVTLNRKHKVAQRKTAKRRSILRRTESTPARIPKAERLVKSLFLPLHVGKLRL